MKKNRNEKKQKEVSQVAEQREMSFNEVMSQIRANRKKVTKSNVGKGSKKAGRR